MIKKSCLFSLFALFVLCCPTTRAQEITAKPAPAPQPKDIFQVFTNDGGSYLGVRLQEVNKENFSKFGLREVRGVAVEKVSENSPAATAGLQNGDVIIRFEGEEVASVRKLQRLIGEVAPDHQAKVTVLREGKEREVSVTMGKRPNITFQNGTFNTITMPNMPVMPTVKIPNIPMQPMANGDNMIWSFAFGRRIGVGTSSLTKQLGDYFGVAEGKGILVTSVSENSPASKGGLKAGDVIIEADGKAVTNSMELMKALNAKEKGSVILTVIRDKNRQTITVEPEERKQNMFDKKITTNGTVSVTPENSLFEMMDFQMEM
jgi:C-terminal processing protease CtpA/Prc